MIDIVIMDYCTCEVIMLKADDRYIQKEFNGDVERYVMSPVEQGGLGFDLESCYFMCGDRIRLICPNGSPFGGIEIGPDAMC